MRAKDIKVGEVYAVLGTRSSYAEKSAVRGKIVEDRGSGSWRVQFEEPMYLQWGSLKPVSEGEPYHYHGQPKPQPITETELDSRCILALWDDHVAKLEAEERAAQSTQDRLASEQAAVERLLEELKAILTWHDVLVEEPLSIHPQQVWHPERRCLGHLTLTPEALDLVVALMRGSQEKAAAVKDETAAAQMGALGSLLVPMLDE